MFHCLRRSAYVATQRFSTIAMPELLVFPGIRTFYAKEWQEIATRHSLDLVELPQEVSSLDKLKEYFKTHDIKVMAVSFGGSKFGKWTTELIESIPNGVEGICHFGAGYDALNVHGENVKIYKSKGIQVSNTPLSVQQATADVALWLILGTLRNFGRTMINLRQGNFISGIPLADEYDGKTLGIWGMGGVGELIRDKVEAAFNFKKIQYHNRRELPKDRAKDTAYVSQDELIETSDVILSVLPHSAATHHIINRDIISRMKKGVYIINVGRGPVIDEDALVDALNSGHVRSVGLDVYEHEPKVHPGLIANENTMLLPHVGTHTVVARKKMEAEVLHNVESLLDTGKVESLVSDLS